MIPVLLGAAAVLGGGWYYWLTNKNKARLPEGAIPTAPSGFSVASGQPYSATFRTSMTGAQVYAGLKGIGFTILGLDPMPGQAAYNVTFTSAKSMALMNTSVYRWENVRVAAPATAQ